MQVVQRIHHNRAHVTVVGVDGLPADVLAMLQAFYSRSHRPIMERLHELNIVDSSGAAVVSPVEVSAFDKMRQSLNTYYIGYGHDSIADCGSTTFFVEGVSFLVAKAIQDDQLYNGQETSSRYIDFLKQPVCDPYSSASELSCLYLDNVHQLLGIYDKVREACFNRFRMQWIDEHKGIPTEQEIRGIRARAFDVARGFLPCGCTTQLSIHVKLRTMRDMIARLLLHPLIEVREVAETMRLTFNEMYPTLEVESAKYNSEDCQITDYYQHIDSDHFDEVHVDLDYYSIREFQIASSGAYSNKLQKFFSEVELHFYLDFGSFRDIQRHRGAVCLMPIVNDEIGLHDFYFSEAVKAFGDAAELDSAMGEVLNRYLRMVEILNERNSAVFDSQLMSEIEAQYALPLGMIVPVHLRFNGAQAAYTINLRSKPTVHPTLRAAMKDIRRQLGNELSNESLNALGIKKFDDSAEDAARRGRATITNLQGTEIK